jgi:hypothetical protein
VGVAKLVPRRAKPTFSTLPQTHVKMPWITDELFASFDEFISSIDGTLGWKLIAL